MKAEMNFDNIGGGGTNIDITNPDKYTNTQISAYGTTTISVDKKPRYIIHTFTYPGSGYGARTMLYDCEKELCLLFGYWGGNWEYSALTYSSYITAISDSSVTIKSYTGINAYHCIAIYY